MSQFYNVVFQWLQWIIFANRKIEENYANIYKHFIVGSHRKFCICNGSWNFNLIKSSVFCYRLYNSYNIYIAYSYDLFISQMWFLGDRFSQLGSNTSDGTDIVILLLVPWSNPGWGLSLAVKGVKVSTSLSLPIDGVVILNRLMSLK